MITTRTTSVLFAALLSAAALACEKTEASEKVPEAAAAPSDAPAPAGISPQKFADGLHEVMKADRTIYTKKVVNRLQNEENVIKASEHWEDDKALPLPAQMFRMGAEMASKADAGFTYSLLSNWPINSQNKPATEIEKKGLDFVGANKGKNFYGEEELGGAGDPVVGPDHLDRGDGEVEGHVPELREELPGLVEHQAHRAGPVHKVPVQVGGVVQEAQELDQLER